MVITTALRNTLKIAIISDVAPPLIGGGESYVIQLGSYLTKLGHDVYWLTSKMPNTRAYENYKGIHIHRVPILFAKNFFFPGRQTFPLTLCLQKLSFLQDIDIVQTNTLVAGYAGWRVAKKFNKPSLLFCHEFFGDLWGKFGNNILERKVYPMIERRIARAPYDWFACPSEYSKTTLVNAGCQESKITVIPHGLNHELFNHNADETYFRKKFHLENLLLFGYIGRLRITSTAQSKNLGLLLKSAQIVANEIPNSRLVLAGIGYREELRPLVQKMGLEKHVIYIGNIPYEENPKFLRMCDLIVCPAAVDGFCFLLAEGSACARPVIATNGGAHPDRIIHNKTGLLVEPTAEAIAKSIIEILTDKKRLIEFGEQGRNYASQYTWQKSVKKHLEVYEMLMS